MDPGQRDQGRGIWVLPRRPLLVRRQGGLLGQARRAVKPAAQSLYQGQIRGVGWSVLLAASGRSCLQDPGGLVQIAGP
jgi:hypothetical protein